MTELLTFWEMHPFMVTLTFICALCIIFGGRR